MVARELFAEIVQEGWPLLEEWTTGKPRKRESVHLEFKTRDEGAAAGKLTQEDRGKLAKAVSGFANVDGGVYVLGVHAKPVKGIDAAVELKPVPQVQLVAEEVERCAKRYVQPTVAGFDVRPIDDGTGTDRGAVVLLVPPSEGGPHQVKGTDLPEYDERFFMRTSKSTEPAPHTYLSALFGRTPPPVLELLFKRDPEDKAVMCVHNAGRGIAENIRVRATVAYKERWVRDKQRESYAQGWQNVNGWNGPSHYAEVRGQAIYHNVSAQEPGLILYPDDYAEVARFTRVGNADHVLVAARIDARSMRPVSVRGVSTIDSGRLSEVDVAALDQLPDAHRWPG